MKLLKLDLDHVTVITKVFDPRKENPRLNYAFKYFGKSKKCDEKILEAVKYFIHKEIALRNDGKVLLAYTAYKIRPNPKAKNQELKYKNISVYLEIFNKSGVLFSTEIISEMD
jgi:hypothetical protein